MLRELVVNVATPLLNVPDPRLVVPSKNCTLPVGTTPPTSATVAVKTNGDPKGEGSRDEVTVAVVKD